MTDFDSYDAVRIAREITDFLEAEGDGELMSPEAWLDGLAHDLSEIDARVEDGDESDAFLDDMIGLSARAIQAAAACGPPEWGTASRESAQELAFALAGTFLSEAGARDGWSAWLAAIWGAHEMTHEVLRAFDEEDISTAARAELGRSLCLNFLLVAGGAIAALAACTRSAA